MANRYTVLKETPYQDIHVNMPFEDIAQAGALKQGRFDKVKAEEDMWLDQIKKVNAIEAHKPRLQQLSGEYKNKFEAAVDESNGDFSKALPKIQKLGRDLSFNLQGGELGAIQTTYNEYGKLKGDIAKQKARDPYYSTKLGGEGQFSDYIQGYQPGSQVQGAYTYNQPVHEKADEAKWAKDFYGEIKADAREVGSTDINTGAVYKGGVKEITQQKINGAALDAVKNKQLPADLNEEVDLMLRDNPQNVLNYAHKFLTETWGNDSHIMNILKDPNQAYMFAKAGVAADLGHKFMFKDTSNINDINVGILKFNKAKKEEDAANALTSYRTEGLNQDVNYLKDVDNIDFDAQGNVKPADQKFVYKGNKNNAEVGVVAESYEKKGYTVHTKEDGDNVVISISEGSPDTSNALIESLRKTYNLEGTPQNVVENYKKAVDSVKNESSSVKTPSNLSRKGIGESVAANLNLVNMWGWDSKLKTEDGTKETVLKEIGISEDEAAKQIRKNGISGITQDGPVAGAYVVKLTNEKGESYTVAVSPPAELQEKYFASSFAINKARKSLIPTTVQPNPDRPDWTVDVKPKINKDGQIHWEYTSNILDPKTNQIKSTPTSLTSIQEAELQAFQESGVLGSGLTNSKDEVKDEE